MIRFTFRHLVAWVLLLGFMQFQARAETLNIATLYTQPVNNTNAVHPLWTPVQHYRGMTFVVCPDLDLRPIVTQIDPAGSITTVFLDTATPIYYAGADGHQRFTIGIDKHGYIHIAGDMHGYAPAGWSGPYVARYQHQSMLYWKSKKALDVTGGFMFCGGVGSTTTLPGVEWGGDSRFFNDRNGELYFSSRVRAFYGSSLSYSEPFIAYGMYRYDTSTGVWTALGGTVPPADAPGGTDFNKVLYWEYTAGFEAYQTAPRFDNDNRLHFAIAGNTAGTTGNGLIYASSDDGGNTWNKASGAAIPGLPIRAVDGNVNQGELVARSTSVVQQSPAYADEDGERVVAGNWTWNGSQWTSHTGGYGILGPDGMLTRESDWALSRATATGAPTVTHSTGFGQVFSMSELALQNTNTIYGIGLPPGRNPNNTTSMSVYKATFTNGPVDVSIAPSAPKIYHCQGDYRQIWLSWAVPATTNVAAGIMPTASTSAANLEFITDGVAGNSLSFTDLGPGLQWLQLDLGKATTLTKLKVWHDYADGRTYRDVIMQVSNDPTFGSGVTTIFNNDTDNSAGQGAGTDSEYSETSKGKRVIVNNIAARYVRLWSNGSTANASNHYVEVEVDAVVPDRATGYNVKRANESGGPYTTIATNVTHPSEFLDAGLANGKIYYYVVSGVNSAGEGPDSAQVSAAPVNELLGPVIQSAVPGNGQVKLTWVALWPRGASYLVKRASAVGGPYVTIATGVTALSYIDAGLTNDTEYHYAVSAYNPDDGESPDSGAIVGVPSRWVKILKYGSVGYDPSVQGVASASSSNEERGEGPTEAFDGSWQSKWLAFSNTGWLQYRFADGTGRAVTRYQLVSGGDGPGRDPKNWQFQGSADGVNWTTLDTRTGQTFAGRRVMNTYSFENADVYPYYRLNVTLNNGDGIIQLSELVLWSDGPLSTPQAINSGGAATGAFTADVGGSTGSSTAIIDTSGVTGPAPQEVYRTERVGNMTYRFANLSAGTSYLVRLHFAEIDGDAVGQRSFNVAINGTQVLANYDIFAEAGAANTATVREFTAMADGSGEIVMDYTSVTDNAKSSGIEIRALVLPAPTEVSVVAGNGLVVLNWDAFPGATSYTVRRATNGGALIILAAGVNSFGYTDTSVVNGMTYNYAVSIVNGGSEGAASSQFSVVPDSPPISASELASPATRIVNGQVMLTVQLSVVGHSYRMQRSDSMSQVDWSNIGEAQNGTGAPLTLLDEYAASVSRRFYRVSIQK